MFRNLQKKCYSKILKSFNYIQDGDITTVDIYEENLPYSRAEIMLQNVTLSGFLGGRGYFFRMNAATLVGTGPWTEWVGPVVLPVLGKANLFNLQI